MASIANTVILGPRLLLPRTRPGAGSAALKVSVLPVDDARRRDWLNPIASCFGEEIPLDMDEDFASPSLGLGSCLRGSLESDSCGIFRAVASKGYKKVKFPKAFLTARIIEFVHREDELVRYSPLKFDPVIR